MIYVMNNPKKALMEENNIQSNDVF